MKRLFLLFAFVIVLLLAYLYIFIPTKVRASNEVLLNIPEAAARNLLVYDSGIARWWPGVKPSVDTLNSRFHFSGTDYDLVKRAFNSASITMRSSTMSKESRIDFNATGENTTAIKWRFYGELPLNPLRRYQEFRLMKSFEVQNTILLNHLKKFAEEEQNIYGIRISYGKITDSVVATIRKVSPTYPSTAEVYSMVEKLERYNKSHAIEKPAPPMLNVTQSAKGEFHVMVGLPARKSLTDDSEVMFRRMVLGNILVTEVRGGVKTVQNALQQMERYIKDKSLTSPAVPFQELITNRQSEPDTTKWITRICYPIF